MIKKIVITILIITLFISIKSYAFTFNPAPLFTSQSAVGMALSIKRDEENSVENIEEQQEKTEETQEGKEESFIDKIINWFKNLFRNDKEANNE